MLLSVFFSLVRLVFRFSYPGPPARRLQPWGPKWGGCSVRRARYVPGMTQFASKSEYGRKRGCLKRFRQPLFHSYCYSGTFPDAQFSEDWENLLDGPFSAPSRAQPPGGRRPKTVGRSAAAGGMRRERRSRRGARECPGPPAGDQATRSFTPCALSDSTTTVPPACSRPSMMSAESGSSTLSSSVRLSERTP